MRLLLFSILLITNLLACAGNITTAQKKDITGPDRDKHGCIASAGYAWCTKTNQCERPWELARLQSFENTQQAFESYCDNVGN